jgi:hypothetical protein
MTVIKNLTENKITSIDEFDIDWQSKSLTYCIKDSKVYQHFKRGMFYWSEHDRCHVIEIETD